MRVQVITVTLLLKDGQEPYEPMEGANHDYDALGHFFEDIGYEVKEQSFEVKDLTWNAMFGAMKQVKEPPFEKFVECQCRGRYVKNAIFPNGIENDETFQARYSLQSPYPCFFNSEGKPVNVTHWRAIT